MKTLDVDEFGYQLLKTNDLDPVYVVLWKADLPRYVLRKWLLAYWCFYHSGTACWIVSQRSYWKAMMTAAKSKDYLRCPERRHFRGQNAIKSVEYLKSVGVEDLFSFFDVGSLNLTAVMNYVKTWVGFGPWIAFKVADMLETLAICEVKFSTSDVFLFDSPREGARRLAEAEDVEPNNVESWAVQRILGGVIKGMKAPPRYDRPVGVQEAETILCKWKSHLNGRYRVGEDVEALQESLLHYEENQLSCYLLAAGEEVGLW